MDELRKEKIELEMRITKAIRDFEDKWDVSVLNVELMNTHDLGSTKCRTLSVKVSVEV